MKFQVSPATGCEPDHSEGNFGSGVAVGSRPPSEPKARTNKTSAWRPKLHSPIKFQVSPTSVTNPEVRQTPGQENSCRRSIRRSFSTRVVRLR